MVIALLGVWSLHCWGGGDGCGHCISGSVLMGVVIPLLTCLGGVVVSLNQVWIFQCRGCGHW